MSTVKDDLIAAKALIANPKKWIKYEPQRDDCFCTLGALGTISPAGLHFQAVYDALPDGEVFISHFNDAPTTTHSDIMALFQRAIDAQGDA